MIDLSASSPGAVHVLEDDPGVSDSLRFLLQALGYEVRLHPDAESFFENPPPRPQDVVIVDLGLPGISGAQTIRWITSLREPPRVIAITGQSQKAIDDEMRDIVGPHHLLRKPLSGERLVAVL
ncbi:response regulator [Methyloraptor flagellatus]|jgi:FixJ family two-component response regulator|uniref:Response regulator n=1 Tax=Methyloraptor flagellatus TaxID=3162530 RepID=A0AAU7X6Q2_9HYPH